MPVPTRRMRGITQLARAITATVSASATSMVLSTRPEWQIRAHNQVRRVFGSLMRGVAGVP